MVKLLFLRWTKLLVDGTGVNESAPGSTTGGFYPENRRWEPAALVKLKQGEHTMHIDSEAVFRTLTASSCRREAMPHER